MKSTLLLALSSLYLFTLPALAIAAPVSLLKTAFKALRGDYRARPDQTQPCAGKLTDKHHVNTLWSAEVPQRHSQFSLSK